jgi:ABC-type arginine transport system permease subunit
MTIVFMSLLALALNQGKLLVNLWLYGFVQFVPMLALLVIAIRGEPRLWPIFIIFYGLSKVAEQCDKQIYSVSPLSGHTLKHLLAAIASWYIFRWIEWSRSQAAIPSRPAPRSA